MAHHPKSSNNNDRPKPAPTSGDRAFRVVGGVFLALYIFTCLAAIGGQIMDVHQKTAFLQQMGALPWMHDDNGDDFYYTQDADGAFAVFRLPGYTLWLMAFLWGGFTLIAIWVFAVIKQKWIALLPLALGCIFFGAMASDYMTQWRAPVTQADLLVVKIDPKQRRITSHAAADINLCLDGIRPITNTTVSARSRTRYYAIEGLDHGSVVPIYESLSQNVQTAIINLIKEKSAKAGCAIPLNGVWPSY